MADIYFVSGIDTDAGKSYCAGWWARRLMDQGHSVITQKFIQTGNVEFSEDIDVHRKLMGTGLLPEDLDHTTAPVIFTYPCSPQLAARIDNKEIDLAAIDNATSKLSERYDTVIIEGAGGLMVPITDEMFTIDYVASRKLPLVLTVHGRLGSINQIILSLEAIAGRGIELPFILYNTYFDSDEVIAADTRAFVERYVRRHFPATQIIDVPVLEKEN
ncbi:MAG: dethiobiotin synthase [Muribaculaceae bacterium]|nr:dethiobiotin synthase [Muribaculaceae bacterium]